MNYHSRLIMIGTSVFLINGLQVHPRATWTYPGPLAKGDADNGQKSRAGFGKKISAAFGRQHKAETQLTTEHTVYWPQDLLPITFPTSEYLRMAMIRTSRTGSRVLRCSLIY